MPDQTVEILVAFLIFLSLVSIFASIACSSFVSAKKDGQDINVEWGGSTPNNAAYLPFGTSEEESFWTEGAANWYYTTTSGIGTLVFEILNDKDDADDLDLYVYDYTAKRLLCKSNNRGNADEKCEVQKTSSGSQKFYINVTPYIIEGGYSVGNIKTSKKSCNQQTTYYCSGNVLRKSGTNYDCTTFDDYIDTCDGVRTERQYYCYGDSEVRKKEITFTEYCSNGYSYCRESSSTKEYYSESCDSTEKCSNGACVPKTCSDYPNTAGSCLLLGNTYCRGGLTGNPYECKDLGNVWCYKKIDTCTSEEGCQDPFGSQGAHCFPLPCTISSVSWDKTSVMVGEDVGITVQGSHCKSSDSVSFEVKENDGAPANNHPASKYFTDNVAKTSWTAEYQKESWFELGDPEYDVYALFNGTKIKSSNQLTVSCPNKDGDSYSSYGGVCGPKDCDDNNENIYPGAPEICNYQDDDCDGLIDEGFDLQRDKNNCGQCKNVCSKDYVCDSGKCKGCGDRICSLEVGENPDNCPTDCYGNLTVSEIMYAPSSVRQGQQVTIQAKILNRGNYVKTLSVEAGIVPDSWEGTAYKLQGLGIQSSIPIESCCSANKYYVAKNVTLNAGQSEIVTFTLYAPTPTSVDACNNLGSAWSENTHKLVIGLYEKCGKGYISSMVQNIKVYRICTGKGDCSSSDYCDFNSGYPGICRPKTCTDQCSPPGSYFCSGNQIIQCIDANNDGCLEAKSITDCSSSNSICIPGQSICKSPPKTRVQLEYADSNTVVHKQQGDIVKLRFIYKGTETIALSYNSSVLTLLDCPDTFTITSDKECLFEVKGEPNNEVEYNIGIINGGFGKLKIISNPSIIVITDRKKLLERYGDKDELEAMLGQAYKSVEKQKGVVYDISDYLTNNLWTKPSEYEGGNYVVV